MKKINIKEIQVLEFGILKQFKKFCKKNKLDFFLVGGTLLGAVRHRGFIPWDDDIDIGMVRSEYNKLYDIVKKNRYIDDEKRYKILLPFEENHIYPYIKIIDTKTIAYEKFIDRKYGIGLWVDIFPYDYGADTKKEIKSISRKHEFYKLFFKVGISGNLPLSKKILKWIAYIPYKLLTKGDYKYWVKKMMQLASPDKTKYMGDIMWLDGVNDMFPAEWFETFTYAEFEGEKFKIPKEYDKWLTHFYGDYMKIPKKEDRVIHDFECYYLGKEKIEKLKRNTKK